MPLGEKLVTALVHEARCEEPVWLSVHRSEDEQGKAYGSVFEED